MKEKKNIDQLFKERFEKFEATPSPHVWENIQARLQEKKQDRKVIPLWWKLTGVAALLALLFTVGNVVFNTSETNSPVVNVEEEALPAETNIETNSPEIKNTVEVASEEDIIKSNAEKSSDRTTNKKHKSSNQNNSKDRIYNKKTNAETSVAVEYSDKVSEKEKSAVQKNTTSEEKIKLDNAKEAIAISDHVPTKDNPMKQDYEDIKSFAKELQQNKLGKENEDLIKKEIGVAETNKVEESKIEVAITEKTDNKKSLLEEIEKNKTKEDAIAENDKPENRWNVAPNVAPVYYSSLGDGSSLDPMLEDNNQNGNVNISYGVNVSYQISDKWSIRSGVSNVDLSYTTGDIVAAEAPVSQALRGINYGDGAIVLTAFDQGTIQALNSGDEGFGQITPKAGGAVGELIQDITYYEVPLELKYALLNKRVGINIIGGLSTLFLGNNEVSVKAGSFESVLGEANNLSTVSFTSNIGLGFGYQISKRFVFNIEPMFKYQLNPYTDSSVNFKPYYVGVYSGLSFKF